MLWSRQNSGIATALYKKSLYMYCRPSKNVLEESQTTGDMAAGTRIILHSVRVTAPEPQQPQHCFAVCS